MYRLAAGLLLNFILALSHSSFPSQWNATTPSRIHSVSGLATLKSEHEGEPPLAARIQSR